MKERVYAAVLGVLCHCLFLAAIGAMAYQVFWGFSRGLLPIGGLTGRIANVLLVLQFPLIHSWLLGGRGRKLLSRMAPFGLGASLGTTTFALISSLQLLLVFLLWTPAESVWFTPQGGTLWISSFVFVGAWVLLIKAISDASLALHSGFLGWGAVVQGKKPRFGTLPTKGLYRVCRQPIYLSFFLILITGPVWTVDHLFIAAVWGAYCFIGPLLKEKRFSVWYGDAFEQYKSQVPYMVPRLVARSSASSGN